MATPQYTEDKIQEELQRIEGLFAKDEKGKAAAAYETLSKHFPTTPETCHFWLNYSAFLYRCEDYNKAEAIANKANEIQPTAEGYHNLGSALAATHRYPEALKAFRHVIHYNPDIFQTHNDMGLCYEKVGQYIPAIDHFQTANILNPESGLTWISLARVRDKAGRVKESLSATRQARKLLGDDNKLVWRSFCVAFSKAANFAINNMLLDEVTQCIKRLDNEAASLYRVCNEIFLSQKFAINLRENITDYRVADFESTLNDYENYNWPTFNHELFSEMMWKVKMCNLHTEEVYTALRYHCLEFALQGTLEDKLWDGSIKFVTALAAQCFFNEYVYYETEDERKMADELSAKIQKQVEAGETPNNHELALLSAYTPMYKLPFAEALAKLEPTEELKRLTKLQLLEPLKEEEIKAGIETLTSIDDSISKLVKEQYEENPYPRWAYCGASLEQTQQDNLKTRYAYITDEDLRALSADKIPTLVAGCGTGLQPIDLALNITNADVLAFDITAASLAYAMRRTEELGITNIKYGLGDILNVQDLGKEFEVIYCTGVLHHMRDPMEGWKKLYDVLKPGGFMMIALYSEIGRRHIVSGRQIIMEEGFATTPQGIRDCREFVKKLPDDHPATPLRRGMDFFTLSSYRDFVFHVQEHRFTLTQIQECLAELNLKFVGFNFAEDATLPRYQAVFPNDPHALNLDQMHRFEEQNPKSFATMYRMWLQKPFDA